MSREIFVSDMDGTLLGSDSLVSERTARLLSRLAEHGVDFTVATARTPATVEPLLERTNTRLPAVVMTGAALWDRGSQSYLSAQELGVEAAQYVGEVVTECGLSQLVYKMGDNGILDLYHPLIVPPVEGRFLEERSHLKLKHLHGVEEPREMLKTAHTILVLALGAKENVLRAVDVLRKDGDRLSVSWYSDPFYPGIFFLEVFGPDVTKAHGIRRLKAVTGATKVTVFGDNYNDLPMMAEADVAVAVGNAVEEVKRAADIVIGPNTEDSVARYIARETGIGEG